MTRRTSRKPVRKSGRQRSLTYPPPNETALAATAESTP